MRAVWSTPLAPLAVEVDGTGANGAVLVTVANVETYHDFLSLTPTASPIDGRFDVFVMPRTFKLGLAWRLFLFKLRLRALARRVPGIAGARWWWRARRAARASGAAPRPAPAAAPGRGLAALERRQAEDEEEVPVETSA